jgi:hypothetical protein
MIREKEILMRGRGSVMRVNESEKWRLVWGATELLKDACGGLRRSAIVCNARRKSMEEHMWMRTKMRTIIRISSVNPS